MTSDALISVSSSCPQSRPETALLLRRGPGLSVFQFVNFGGRHLESFLDATYRGPIGPKDKINNFISEYEARERVLDELYKSDQDNLTRPHKKLRGYCRDLLQYANAQSHTISTQLVTFKILIAVITKYPGIRRLFYHPKDCGQAVSALKEAWTPAHQKCGEEWNFYLDYALHCLSDSQLTALVEKELPSELGRLELPVDDWNKLPFEELLSFCKIPELDSINKLSAVRYIAGILELPNFWEKGVDVQNRFSGILTCLWCTILELIQDTEKSEAQVDVDVDLPPCILAARDAADILASSTFDGFLRLHERDQFVPPHPPELQRIVKVLQRPEMEKAFPKASDRVPRVAKILLSSQRVQNPHSGKPFHKIHGEGERYVMPDVGSTSGITIGAEFEVYQDEDSGSLLGTVVASEIRPFSTTLDAKGSRFALEGDSIAFQTRAGTEGHALRIHVADEGLKELVKEIETIDPSLKIKLVDRRQAEFGMALENGKVVFDILDSDVTRYGLTRMPFVLEPAVEVISPIIRAADHFYWHLRQSLPKETDAKIGLATKARKPFILESALDVISPIIRAADHLFQRSPLRKETDPKIDLANSVEIEVAEVEHCGAYNGDLEPVMLPTQAGWTRGRHFDLQIKDEQTVYGWKIVNYGNLELFPALFFFDNSDWSITSYYQPPTERRGIIVEPPLKRRQYLSVGFGDSETLPRTYFLRDGQDVDVGFLKLFLSKEQVDLSNIPQASPFASIMPRSFIRVNNRVKIDNSRLFSDIIQIPVVQRRAAE